jgi:hypothetical protein
MRDDSEGGGGGRLGGPRGREEVVGVHAEDGDTESDNNKNSRSWCFYKVGNTLRFIK